MTNTRHPDIEIYVKNRSLEAIQEWLQSHADQLECTSSKNNIHEFTLTFQDNNVETLIHERVAGKAWTSVWLKSDTSPWATDLECAHAASKELETQIRCIASGWNDGDDPDEYWKVEDNAEEKIQWQT
ncbi:MULTISPECIES: hypothetical protein [unclassified Neptuniibacter]|uniref:hypothetical protein n=1 Tax=unclassified Neptuniibacter TaxID=2630693 RepID=UPI000C6596F5|nr:MULTISPECIES: hypothetical protein [unclassified Neptuniibacter]MAY43251.1 hypothetical protein [Oceanospirillaceae bacterium]|tara:strand:- start:3028 stop:3411 length:384 start_codon:yes stop_codon:yes gene_type:complete